MGSGGRQEDAPPAAEGFSAVEIKVGKAVEIHSARLQRHQRHGTYLGALAAPEALGKSEDCKKFAARPSWRVRSRLHWGSGPGLSKSNSETLQRLLPQAYSG